MEEQLAKEIYEKTEDSIYNLLGQHLEFDGLQQTMVYMHMRAYYIILVKLYLKAFNRNDIKFEEVFGNYKMILINYYKENNPGIPEVLLNDLIQSFDVSFQLIESLELENVLVLDSLKKFTKEVLSNLHAILERRSKKVISTSFINNEKIFCDTAVIVKETCRNL